MWSYEEYSTFHRECWCGEEAAAASSWWDSKQKHRPAPSEPGEMNILLYPWARTHLTSVSCRTDSPWPSMELQPQTDDS